DRRGAGQAEGHLGHGLALVQQARRERAGGGGEGGALRVAGCAVRGRATRSQLATRNSYGKLSPSPSTQAEGAFMRRQTFIFLAVVLLISSVASAQTCDPKELTQCFRIQQSAINSGQTGVSGTSNNQDFVSMLIGAFESAQEGTPI